MDTQKKDRIPYYFCSICINSKTPFGWLLRWFLFHGQLPSICLYPSLWSLLYQSGNLCEAFFSGVEMLTQNLTDFSSTPFLLLDLFMTIANKSRCFLVVTALEDDFL